MIAKDHEHYRRFSLTHQPERYTYAWFVQALDLLWDMLETGKSNKTDWQGFEQFNRDVLSASFPDDKKVALLKGAVGAFTGRGAVEG